MTTPQTSNGTMKLMYWIMGSMATLILFLMGLITSSLYSQITTHDEKIQAATSTNERQDSEIHTMQKSFERIEAKLDKVLNKNVSLSSFPPQT